MEMDVRTVKIITTFGLSVVQYSNEIQDFPPNVLQLRTLFNDNYVVLCLMCI